MTQKEKAIYYYLNAKKNVVDGGFHSEVAWQEAQSTDEICQKDFLAEYAWVVLSSGMRETVIRNKFHQLSILFNHWDKSAITNGDKRTLRRQALKIFNHVGKIEAILTMIQFLTTTSFSVVIDDIQQHGVSSLQKFPYLGPATSLHFAKNLGFDVAKPDRHLVRISKAFGYKCPSNLCSDIAEYTGEKKSVIDIVLWRFATINKNYLKPSFF